MTSLRKFWRSGAVWRLPDRMYRTADVLRGKKPMNCLEWCGTGRGTDGRQAPAAARRIARVRQSENGRTTTPADHTLPFGSFGSAPAGMKLLTLLVVATAQSMPEPVRDFRHDRAHAGLGRRRPARAANRRTNGERFRRKSRTRSTLLTSLSQIDTSSDHVTTGCGSASLGGYTERLLLYVWPKASRLDGPCDKETSGSDLCPHSLSSSLKCQGRSSA